MRDDRQAVASPAALPIALPDLLGNAAKLTRRASRARVEVSARDNGAGFDPFQADPLFKPFKRLPSRDGRQGVPASA